MALSNFTDLSASIASWSHRTDTAALIPDFITLAEKRIVTMLRARLQETAATINTVVGVASASLPSTLLGIQSMSIANVSPTIEYVTPDELRRQYPDSTVSGAPRFYTTIGDTAVFGPAPDAVYVVAITYHASVTPLTAAAPVNALLTKWPNTYLFGALVEAANYAKDAVAKQEWDAKFQDAVMGVNMIDWHAGGPMRVRSDVRSN